MKQYLTKDEISILLSLLVRGGISKAADYIGAEKNHLYKVKAQKSGLSYGKQKLLVRFIRDNEDLFLVNLARDYNKELYDKLNKLYAEVN